MPTPRQRQVYQKWLANIQEIKNLGYKNSSHADDLNWYKNPPQDYLKWKALMSKGALILKKYMAITSPRDRHHLNAERKNPNHVYMVTFTIDAKKFKGKSIEEITAYGEKRLQALPKTKGLRDLGIINYVYALEYTKKGMPHWHLSLETSHSVPRPKKGSVPSVFRYEHRTMGNVDFSETVSRDTRDTFMYISKETTPKMIIVTEQVEDYLTQFLNRNYSDNRKNIQNKP